MHIKVTFLAFLSWLPLIPVAESSFANPHDLRYVLFICGKLVSVALSKIFFRRQFAEEGRIVLALREAREGGKITDEKLLEMIDE